VSEVSKTEDVRGNVACACSWSWLVTCYIYAIDICRCLQGAVGFRPANLTEFLTCKIQQEL